MSDEAPDIPSLNVRESALPKEDKAAFDRAERRAADGEYDPKRKTIGEIIADEKAFEAGR